MKVGLIITVILVSIICSSASLSNNVDVFRKNYPDKITEIQLFLNKMKTKYSDNNEEAKKKILNKCSQKLFDILTSEIFPAWYGTKWSFSGTSKIPGKGSIACGYFVIHTLQDVGFKIPSKMAMQPSENIIKNLINPKDIMRYSSGTNMSKVRKWIMSQGEGLFIVGLDIHVGFIINKRNKITFCHSNYYPPQVVENGDIIISSPLTDSKYRVIGKILSYEMMQKWIEESQFLIKYDYFNNFN